ncbi:MULTISPECIES: TetR/AcrR family transcriptional regulator [unclassified Nocardioides]|uniref:TetR/AcrR family transcriptional regulator n=1 Tax=unclassified Nocardioides TaxID=2615069 RepID=UPI00361549C2
MADRDAGHPKRRYAPRLSTEERREHLLDAALHVIARDGYEKVSIEAVAREAGVSRPVVYSAYDGLDSLLHALLHRTQQRALHSALALLPTDDDDTDPRTWAVTALGGLLDLVQREPDVWRPVLGLTRDAPAFVREEIEATRVTIRDYIADRVRARLATPDRPVDAEIVGHLLMTSAEEFARLLLDDPVRYPSERLVRCFADLLGVEVPVASGAGTSRH